MTKLSRNVIVAREAGAGFLAARQGQRKQDNPHAERGETAMQYHAWAAGWETFWQLNDGVVSDEE